MLNIRRSWFKALSFLCIVSLALSIIPPVGIWQSVRAADTTLYNGGYTSYNGHDYKWWVENVAQVKTQDDKNWLYSIPNPNNPSQYLYFNCEIYAERKMVVYGEPWDVPQNEYSSPVGFKEDSPQNDNGNDGKYGYFYKQNTTTRGWYRYIG